MATAAHSSASATVTIPADSVRPLVLSTENDSTPQWLKDLDTRGWAVVKQTIPREKALSYADEAYKWLEGWNLGYKRDDTSTRNDTHLPYHVRGGLYNRYGVAHEQFVWDLKSEPEIIDKFAQIWGTDELLVSYDGINLSIPDKERPKTDPLFAPWSHVDQSPFRKNLQCVQGILNLLPNGPDDGGLMVLENSKMHYTELWEHFDHKKGEKGWNTWEQQMVDAEMCEWLQSKGCKWVKACAEPGDLLLWDSRTVHYGATPSSTNDRFAVYVCYKPAYYASEETKAERKELFEKRHGTAHDPAVIRVTPRYPPEDHPTHQDAVDRPLQNPVLSKRGRQLVGLDPY